MSSIGLAMIVKNGASTLRESIASVEGIADQIVIADTGSTDGTPQLARQLEAEVLEIAWQDDFAQARNAAVRALTTDWVLILDDDEELDAEARHKIPSLLKAPNVGGYYFIQRSYLPCRFGEGGHAPSVKPIRSTVPRAERSQGYADHRNVRLFRRHSGIYYVGRVHELVDASIQRLGLELRSSNCLIHHFGLLRSHEERHKKDEFYRKLGWLKVKDLPKDAQAWIEIGLQEYEQFNNYSAGIECFTKALVLNPNCSTVPYLSLAQLYIDIHDDARALELLSGVSVKGRAAGERENICGDAFYNLGRLKDARGAYLRALRILPEDARVISKLGLTEVRLGLKKNGLARLIKALTAAPEVLDMHDRLVKAYLLMNMLPEAADAAERLALRCGNPGMFLRAVSIRAQNRVWKAAAGFMARALQIFPEDQGLVQAMKELERELFRERGQSHMSQVVGDSAQCTDGRSGEMSLSPP